MKSPPSKSKRGELEGEILATSGRAEHAQDRAQISDRFASEDDLILVSTDATAEGLNLQDRCHHLIHLELPYNPNRLEQRNGRIDRYGQRHTPQVQYLYLAGTFEERLLLRLVAKYERQCARLTFVPDTLGGITTDDAQTVRLLEGLADEEATLFSRPSREIRQIESDSGDDLSTPAYQKLLAEVERAMTGYEKAAKSSVWLGEAGLNAEARLVNEANQAREEGERLGAVELTQFVERALEDDRDTSSPVRKAAEDSSVIELHLPSSWTHGLPDVPGYDESSRTLRITRDRSRTRDAAGRSLGFPGRAHPVVRRALDRVRNVRFGDSGAFIDRRVSAIALDTAAPELLCTFLGIVESERGHELERVLAVRINEAGTPLVYESPEEWLALLDEGKPIATKQLWERDFAAWGGQARGAAQAEAAAAFARVAASQIDDHRQQIESERTDLNQWLAARAENLCGTVQQVQADLFADAQPVEGWRTDSNPASRLATFAMDAANSPAARREAEGVLLLFQKRDRELRARAEVRIAEPQPLGMLMIVPAAGGTT